MLEDSLIESLRTVNQESQVYKTALSRSGIVGMGITDTVDSGDLPVQTIFQLIKPNDIVENLCSGSQPGPLFEVGKTGSTLKVYYNIGDSSDQLNGLFIHSIPINCAKVWADLFNGVFRLASGDPIPVEPILTTRQSRLRMHPQTNGNMVVLSRYCGIPLSLALENDTSLFRLLDLSGLTRKRDEIVRIKRELRHRLNCIQTALRDNKIDHGHNHLDNFTFELINREYFLQQIGQGFDVNSIRYQAKYWSFDLNNLVNSNDWEVVVWLIDFDRVRIER